MPTHVFKQNFYNFGFSVSGDAPTMDLSAYMDIEAILFIILNVYVVRRLGANNLL